MLWADFDAYAAANALIGVQIWEYTSYSLDLDLIEAVIRAIFETIHTTDAGLEVHLGNADHGLPLFFQRERRDRTAGADLAAQVTVWIARPTDERIHHGRPHAIPARFKDGRVQGMLWAALDALVTADALGKEILFLGAGGA